MAQLVQQRLEQVEGLGLVLVQRIALAVAAQADPFLEVVERVEVVLPLLVDDLQRQVDSLNVRSPVDGLLGNLAVENKTYIIKNQLILSVVDLSQFEVEIAVHKDAPAGKKTLGEGHAH